MNTFNMVSVHLDSRRVKMYSVLYALSSENRQSLLLTLSTATLPIAQLSNRLSVPKYLAGFMTF